MHALSSQTESTEESSLPQKVISGKMVVVVMFLFGAVITAFLFFYWTKHTARFRPLQDAIALEFKGSMPRVEGGQRKKHLELSPLVLRITMKVKFDPISNFEQTDQYIKDLTKFIQQHENIRQFDKLEYHFYQLNPEDKIKQKTFTYDAKTLSVLENEKARFDESTSD